MQLAKDFIGRPVFSVSEGCQLGTVKDVYLDGGLLSVAGLYLGSGRLLSCRFLVIERSNITVFGVDAILVQHAAVVVRTGKDIESAKWIRRDRLQGQSVVTSGGAKVGTIDDALLNAGMRVIGFSLARVFVEDPVADNRAIVREALIDFGKEDQPMIVDLAKAERQTLKAQ